MKKNTLSHRYAPMMRISFFSFLFAGLFIINSSVFAQEYKFGFENGTADGWVNNTSTTGNAVVNTAKRTGTYSFKTSMSSAGTNRGLKRPSITVTPNTNLHAIAWVKATNAGASAGLTLSGGTTGLNNVSVSNSSFSQIYVTYANANNSTRELRLYYSNSSATETLYIDDIIVYASSSSTIDLTSPNAPTSLSGSTSGGSALLNWSSGGDGTGTGVQATLVLKYTGTGTPTAPLLNNQAVYELNDIPATDWVVVKNDGTATGSSVNVGAISSNTTYAVYHRDLAYNWSAPATTTVTTITGTLPTVSTTIASGITTNAAVSGGNVTAEGTSAVTVKGIVFGTSTSPTSNATNNGTGLGNYGSNLSGLTGNTKYYYRAFASSAVGTAYGSENNFTTLPNAPAIGTANNITSTGFTSTWTALPSGADAVSYTIEVDNDINFGSVDYTRSDIITALASVTGLTPSTTYYYRVKAVTTTGSSAWSSTSAGVTTTSISIPTVTTTTITGITINTATSGGNVTSDGGAAVTARGVAYNTTSLPTIANTITNNGSGTGTFSSSLSGLTANQTYYVRAYATNSVGTAYGSEQSFVTMATEPTTVSTISFGTVTNNSIVVNFSGGNGANRIVVVRSASAVNFTPTDGNAASGVNASFSSATDQGNGNKVVYDGTGSTVTVTGLSQNTVYYFAVFEYNKNSAAKPNYYATAATGNKTTTNTSSTPVLTIGFNTTLTGPFINGAYVSGVINDPTDPVKQNGIVVDVKDNGVGMPAADYTLTAASSKTSVVPVANVTIVKGDGTATIKITPAAVGYAKITLTLKKGSSSKTLAINYAASAASSTPSTTTWHTGYSDASAAIALDDNYMVVGDDEKNNLYVVDRTKSGLAVKTYYFGDLLGLTDGSTGNYKEVDVEASVRSKNVANRVYWLGSMSNAGSDDSYKPNSNTVFATNITGTGTSTNISVTGYYHGLRQQLISWGDTKGYNLTSSAANGHVAKTIDGFNVEGMTIAPDNTTLYIGFRAPLVPTSNRTKALIAPLLNFETWFNNGSPAGNPTFGNPIELNLGGRGIRDIIRLSNGKYIIVAGNSLGSPLKGAIFKWTGNAADAPVQLTDMNIANLNVEACVEIQSNGQIVQNKLEIISDEGSTDFYNDDTEAKDLSQDNYKKYRSDIITGNTGTLARPSVPVVVNDRQIRLFPNPVTTGSFTLVLNERGVKQVRIFDNTGALQKELTTTGISKQINTTGLAKGNYEVIIMFEDGSTETRRIVIMK